MGALANFDAWQSLLVDVLEADVLEPGVRVDSHVHVGIDAGSGLEVTPTAIDEQLARAHVDGALLIPLNASDGYHETNLRVAQLAAERGKRFHALARVEASTPDIAARAREYLDAGACGFKLHPVSDDAEPQDPRLDPLFEIADAERAIVVVHCGIDVETVAQQTIERARRHPGAQVVFGHLPAEAFLESVRALDELDNLFVSTAWWGPYDLELAMRWCDPSRFLLGSDPPYSTIQVGLIVTALAAAAAGYDQAEISGVLGGNFQQLVSASPVPHGRGGEEIDLQPTLEDPMARLPVCLRRCYQYLLSAGGATSAGASPETHGRMARAALERATVPAEFGAVAELLRDGIAIAVELFDEHPEHAFAAFAALLAVTSAAPLLQQPSHA